MSGRQSDDTLAVRDSSVVQAVPAAPDTSAAAPVSVDTTQPATADSAAILQSTFTDSSRTIPGDTTATAEESTTVLPDSSALDTTQPTPADSAAILQSTFTDSSRTIPGDTTATAEESTTVLPDSSALDTARIQPPTGSTETTVAVRDTLPVSGPATDTTMTTTVETPPDTLVEDPTLDLPPDTIFVASIIQPAYLQTITSSLETFAAFIYGHQSHFVSDSEVVWQSDQDGEIGRGTYLLTAGLSAGPHVLTLTVTNPDSSMVAVDTTVILVQDQEIQQLPAELSPAPVTFPEDSVLGNIVIAIHIDTAGAVGEIRTLRNTTGSIAHQDSIENALRKTTFWPAETRFSKVQAWTMKEYAFGDSIGYAEQMTFRTTDPVDLSKIAFSSSVSAAPIAGTAGSQLQRRNIRSQSQTIITEEGEWMAGLPDIVVPGSPRISIEVPRGFFGGGRPVQGSIQAIVKISPYGFVRELITLDFQTEGWVMADFIRMFRETLYLPMIGVAPRDRLAYCEFNVAGDHFEELRGKSLRGWRTEWPVTFPAIPKGSMPTMSQEAQEKGVNGYFIAITSVDDRGRYKEQKKLHEFPKDITGLRDRFLDIIKNQEYKPATVKEIPANTYMFYQMGFRTLTDESRERLRKSYDEGVRKFLVREYEVAIEHFQAVIDLDVESKYRDVYPKLVICYSHSSDPIKRIQPERAYWFGLRRMALYNNFSAFADLLNEMDEFTAARYRGIPLLASTVDFEQQITSFSTVVGRSYTPRVKISVDSVMQTFETPLPLKLAGLSGEILVGAYIGKDGDVQDVILQRPFGIKELDERAVQFVKNLPFTPAMIDSAGVDHWTQVRIPIGDPDLHIIELFPSVNATVTVDSVADSLAVAEDDSIGGGLPDSLSRAHADTAVADTVQLPEFAMAPPADTLQWPDSTASMTMRADSFYIPYPDSLNMKAHDTLLTSGQDTMGVSADSTVKNARENVIPALPPRLFTHVEGIPPEALRYQAGGLKIALTIDRFGVATALMVLENHFDSSQKEMENSLAEFLFGSLFAWVGSPPPQDDSTFVASFHLRDGLWEEDHTPPDGKDIPVASLAFPRIDKLAGDMSVNTTADAMNGLYNRIYRVSDGEAPEVLGVPSASVLSQTAIDACDAWINRMEMQPGSHQGTPVVSYISFNTVFYNDSTAAMSRLLDSYVQGFRALIEQRWEKAIEYLEAAALWDIRGQYPQIISQLAYCHERRGNLYDMVQEYGRHALRYARSKRTEPVTQLLMELQLLRASVKNGRDFDTACKLRNWIFDQVVALLDAQHTPRIIGGRGALMSVIQYPQTNLGARLRGAAEVTVLINENGNIQYSEVTRSMGDPAYDKAALDAVKRVKYEPAVLNNTAVACWTTIAIPF